MATPVLTAAPEEPQGKSFGARFVGVFISPGSTFADIARRPDFLFPLLALVASSVLVTETMMAKIGMERIVRASLERSGRASQMTPEQLEQAVSRSAGFGAVFAHIVGVIGFPLLVLIVAAVGLGIVNLIFGAQTNFKTAFSVACFAYMPGVLGALMAVALIFLGDAEHFNPQSPVPSNLGFFLDPQGVPKPLISLATSFDLFTLWYIVLLGMGFSQASGGKARAVPVGLVFFGLWMVIVLGKMGFAALM